MLQLAWFCSSCSVVLARWNCYQHVVVTDVLVAVHFHGNPRSKTQDRVIGWIYLFDSAILSDAQRWTRIKANSTSCCVFCAYTAKIGCLTTWRNGIFYAEKEREREEDDLLYFWKATRFLFSFECFFHRIFLWFKHLQPPARNYDSPQAIVDCCRRKITSQRNFIAHQDPVTTKFLIWGILIQRIRRKWLKKCSWENDRADRCQVDRIFIILLRDLYRLFGINLIKLRSS